MSAHTWREVEWEYDGAGWIVARGSGEAICYVPNGRCRDKIGRAIVQCWNTDIAAARAMGELGEDREA